jgi:nucleotide-binding universal stress UspA family protein
MSKRIVVGIDGSKESRRALTWAVREAELRGAHLRVVHAYATPWEYWEAPVPTVPIAEVEKAQRKLMEDEVADALVHHHGVSAERVLVNDLPARALLEQSKDADLLVVGSRGRGGFSGLLLGSVSQHVSHHAPCPVVIVPPAKG